MTQTLKISEVLKAIVPKDQEELSALRFVLDCAQWLRRASHFDLGLGRTSTASLESLEDTGAGAAVPLDIQGFLEQLSEESKRYLSGLMEALDIYHSIHGEALTVQTISLSDSSVYELRQIRDMCLEEGLRSIY